MIQRYNSRERRFIYLRERSLRMKPSYFNQQLYRYGKSPTSHDLIKALGIVLMFIDHLGYYIFPEHIELRIIGRGAAPLFFFLIGYTARLHINKRLISFGVILTLTGTLYSNYLWVNILLNFILTHFLIQLIPFEKLSDSQRTLLFISLFLLNALIMPYIEYGLLGVMLAYAARLLALKADGQYFWTAIACLIYLIVEATVFNLINNELFFSIAIIMLIIYSVFVSYQNKTFNITRPINLVIIFLSRFSLEIYFYHVLLFQLLHFVKL